jgi:uncharacterized damage-inducible protein DinB
VRHRRHQSIRGPCVAHRGASTDAGRPAPAGDTSKDATLKYLNAVLDWSVSVVKQLTPADLTSKVTAGRGNPMTGLDALLNAMVHTAHTRGYSDTYLRNKGVKPPTYQV